MDEVEAMARTKPLALGAAILIGLLSPSSASAQERHHRVHPVPAPILDPALDDAAYSYRDPFGDAIYNGYFGEPVLYSAYHGDGSCYFARHRVATPYGPRFRVTQICG